MKAAVLNAPKTPLTIEDLTIDEPIAGEALVRVVAAGVCHSDLHFIEGTYPGRADTASTAMAVTRPSARPRRRRAPPTARS